MHDTNHGHQLTANTTEEPRPVASAATDSSTGLTAVKRLEKLVETFASFHGVAVLILQQFLLMGH
jgi:hypothetical protein